MPVERFRIELTVRGPVLAKDSVPGEAGVDAVCLRDASGRIVLPGTTLTGKLRDAWQTLGDASAGIGEGVPLSPDVADRWLGRGGRARHAMARKRLVIDDLVAEDPGNGATRTRIAIDDDTGTARSGALQVIEEPFRSGQPVTFGGVARAFVEDGEVDDLETALRIGLNWIPAIGAHRSVGFGRVLGAAVAREDRHRRPAGAATGQMPQAPIPLLLEFDQPICVTDGAGLANAFRSTDVLPGHVLKGAIADQWALAHGRETSALESGGAASDFEREFARVQVDHAFPVPASGGPAGQPARPVVPPLSLVFGGDVLLDAALEPGPFTVDGRAPVFSTDWKSPQLARVDALFGWQRPRRGLRVRTRIDPELRRAEDEALFAYECVLTDGHRWLTSIDLGRIEDDGVRARVWEELRALLDDGLFRIGKTKAAARVHWLDGGRVGWCMAEREPSAHGPWVVTLQSAALLAGEPALHEESDAAALARYYRSAWEAVSGGDLTLVRYFARQRLYGGEYVRAAYLGPARPYRPFLLTEPGSVFVVEPATGVPAERARARLLGLRRDGLPLSRAAVGHYELPDEPLEQWRACPFVPENGYGRLALELDCHRSMYPDSAAIGRVAGWPD